MHSWMNEQGDSEEQVLPITDSQLACDGGDALAPAADRLQGNKAHEHFVEVVMPSGGVSAQARWDGGRVCLAALGGHLDVTTGSHGCVWGRRTLTWPERVRLRRYTLKMCRKYAPGAPCTRRLSYTLSHVARCAILCILYALSYSAQHVSDSAPARLAFSHAVFIACTA